MVSPRVPRAAARFGRRLSIGRWRRFIAALQDCVMQIGRMRFARIERDDHALVLEIDFYVWHSGNVLQHRSQFAHAVIAIFTFSGNFDRFQDRIVGPFRKNRSAGSGSGRSSRVHRVLIIAEFNIRSEALVAGRCSRSLWQAPNVATVLAASRAAATVSPFRAPPVRARARRFQQGFLAGCVRMNAVGRIQRGIACHAFKSIGHQRRSIFRR